MHKIKWILILLLITGCEANIDAYFCPQDNCQEKINKRIRSSTKQHILHDIIHNR